MNKKEQKLKEVEQFVKKYNISGIFLIPDIGTFSIFKTLSDKLLLLEQAQIEIAIRQQLVKKEAMVRASEHTSDIITPIKQKEVTYVG